MGGQSLKAASLLLRTSSRERGSRGHELGVVPVRTERAARGLELSAFGEMRTESGQIKRRLPSKKDKGCVVKRLQATPSSRDGAMSRWSKSLSGMTGRRLPDNSMCLVGIASLNSTIRGLSA